MREGLSDVGVDADHRLHMYLGLLPKMKCVSLLGLSAELCGSWTEHKDQSQHSFLRSSVQRDMHMYP